MIKATPVILFGGSGTRLWPLSRNGLPKHFLCLAGNESLFQQAVLHLASLGYTDFRLSTRHFHGSVPPLWHLNSFAKNQR